MDQPEIACPLDVSERQHFNYHPLEIRPERYIRGVETWLDRMENICHRCIRCFSPTLLYKVVKRLKYIGSGYHQEFGNRIAGLLLRIDRLQEKQILGE